MALQNRNSVMAIVEETTEGTPIAPSSATDDYIALQDGFSVEPAFEELSNDELTGSIGMAKSIQGFESPTGSVSHYMKHSGVEGQEPNFGLLIESVLGAKVVEGTEYNTIAGSTAGDASTRGKVVVDSGEGVQFERGQGLLIKDGTNGYAVRNVYSVATDDLNLSFNLANAPGVGVNLGKAVMYKPADSGHPTFSSWVYRANGGAVEMLAGCRATEMSLTADAGQLVNADFSIEGIEYFFNPIEIAASDIYLDFTSDNGTFAATVSAGWYKDPHELAAAIETALNTADPLETFTCVFSDSTGKFTIATSTSAVLSLLWNTGGNAANTIGDKIGFSVAADDTGATSYVSDTAQSYAAPHTPTYDSTSPVVAKANEVKFGDFDDYACFGASNVSVSISGSKADLLSLCASSGKSGSLITEREVSIEVVARLDQHDADKFRRYRSNSNVEFSYSFGEKSGGNWVAGKVCNIYVPTAVISEYSIQDTDGVLELNMTLKGYVSNGLGEVYVNFL